jgi:hypothetical protein
VRAVGDFPADSTGERLASCFDPGSELACFFVRWVDGDGEGGVRTTEGKSTGGSFLDKGVSDAR